MNERKLEQLLDVIAGVLIFSILSLILINASFAGETKVNINTGTQTELMEIKHIGKVLSGRIVKARPFTAVDSLINIKGIGVKILAKIKPFVTISDSTHIHLDEQ